METHGTETTALRQTGKLGVRNQKDRLNRPPFFLFGKSGLASINASRYYFS
jgi:hypothetical protein